MLVCGQILDARKTYVPKGLKDYICCGFQCAHSERQAKRMHCCCCECGDELIGAQATGKLWSIHHHSKQKTPNGICSIVVQVFFLCFSCSLFSHGDCSMVLSRSVFVSLANSPTGRNECLYVIHNLLIISSDGFAIILKTSIINFFFVVFFHPSLRSDIPSIKMKEKNASKCVGIYHCTKPFTHADFSGPITYFGMQFKIIYTIAIVHYFVCGGQVDRVFFLFVSFEANECTNELVNNDQSINFPLYIFFGGFL